MHPTLAGSVVRVLTSCGGTALTFANGKNKRKAALRVNNEPARVKGRRIRERRDYRSHRECSQSQN
jgi:hypothetical protein